MIINNYDGNKVWLRRDHISMMYTTKFPLINKPLEYEPVTCISLLNRDSMFTKESIEDLIELMQAYD